MPSEIRLRQEVLNSVLSGLLTQHGIEATPERVLTQGGTRMPDLMATLHGLRVVVEAEVDSSDAERKALESARERVSSGIANLSRIVPVTPRHRVASQVLPTSGITRVAGLVIINAMMFQEVLSSFDRRVKGLRVLLRGAGAGSADDERRFACSSDTLMSRLSLSRMTSRITGSSFLLRRGFRFFALSRFERLSLALRDLSSLLNLQNCSRTVSADAPSILFAEAQRA